MKVIILLGYLGSGKTTLAEKILEHFASSKVAVIVNDFGDSNVDETLLRRHTDRIYEISGGSIFCNCKSDKFLQALEDVSAQSPEYVIVETSGMANPFTMTDIIDFARKKRGVEATLLPVIATVDATNFEKLLPQVRMMSMQIAASDVTLINKCDLVGESDIVRITDVIRGINADCSIVSTTYSQMDMSLLNGIASSKRLPLNMQDILTQKIMIELRGCTEQELSEFSSKMSSYCHRIKGKVEISGNYYVYEYINGSSKLTLCDKDDRQFLILLGVVKTDLRQMAVANCSEKMRVI